VIAVLVLHTAAAGLIGAVLLAMLRWIRRRSRAAASIVAAGVLARVAIGLPLFWISYLHLPIGTSLQFGDGFWILASDAPAYQRAALAVPAWGFGPSPGSSGGYVRVLAIWLHLVGQSPAAGLYLNVLMFVVTAAIVIAVVPAANDWRRDAPVLAGVAAFSFNPTLVGHATQPLKDTFMALALALGCAAAYVLFKVLDSEVHGPERARRSVVAIVGLLLSIYLVARIRPYFIFVQWGCYLVAAIVSFSAETRQRIQTFSVHAITLIALWAVMAYGGGSYYNEVMERTVNAGVNNPSALYRNSASFIKEAQIGFVRTASGTNAAAADIGVSEGNSTPGVRLAGGWNVRKGLVLMFVPVAIATPMRLLRLEGGRGLLAAADIDTMFIDASVLLILLLCVARRHELRRNLPYFSFTMSIAVVSAGLIAYVVTNLGTLLRLRLMFGVPLWMTAIALVPLAYAERRDASPDAIAAELGVDRR
jgi:hypothetical protein